MRQETIWIDWLGNVRNVSGKIGTLIAGPVARGGNVVYVVDTYEGRVDFDWRFMWLTPTKVA
jgi:hypothetical protein